MINIFPCLAEEKLLRDQAFYVSNLETHVPNLETPVPNLETEVSKLETKLP